MDTVALVEYQIDDGQRLLDRLNEKGVVVRAGTGTFGRTSTSEVMSSAWIPLPYVK